MLPLLLALVPLSVPLQELGTTAPEAEVGGEEPALPAPPAEEQAEVTLDPPPAEATPPALGLPPETAASRWLSATTWEQLCARDERLSFVDPSGAAALAEVEAGGAPGRDLGPALLALGETRHLPARPLLRSRAAAGPVRERQAAVLALGGYGAGDEELLAELAADADEQVARCAVLALARSSSAGRRRVRALSDGGEPRASWAREALGFYEDRLAAGPAPAAERLLELRWEAARRYGLVSGREWEALVVEALCASDRFLEAVVVPEASRGALPRVRDHLLQHLLDVGGPVITRVVARSMPSELARVVQSGLWAPPSRSSWAILLDEIERGKPHPDVVALLRLALLRADLRERASLLWIGTGDPEAAELVGDFVSAESVGVRAGTARALGSTGDPRWIPELSRLRLDPSAVVRTEALVAQVRLGHGPALERVQGITAGTGPGASLRPRVLEVLGDLAYDARLHPLLLESMQGATPAETLRLAAVLVEQGVTAPRAIAREALRQGLAGPHGAAMVRGLAQGADAEDRELLRSLFPAEGPLEMNVELARALLRNREPRSAPILEAALWSGPWHRSHLAAELLVSMRGLNALRAELDAPPGGTSPEGLRRVGFALGELGGVREVEELSRRRRTGDPALQGAYLGALSARTR